MKISVGTATGLALFALEASAKTPGPGSGLESSAFGVFERRNVNIGINANTNSSTKISIDAASGNISHDDDEIFRNLLKNSHSFGLIADLRGGSSTSKDIGNEITNSPIAVADADVDVSGGVGQSKKRRGFFRRNIKKMEVTDSEEDSEQGNEIESENEEELDNDNVDGSQSTGDKVSNDSSFAQYLDSTDKSSDEESQSNDTGTTTKASKEIKKARSGIFSFGRKRKSSESIINPDISEKDSNISNDSIDSVIGGDSTILEKQGSIPETEVNSQAIEKEILDSKDNVEDSALTNDDDGGEMDEESNKNINDTVSNESSIKDVNDQSQGADDGIEDGQEDTKDSKDAVNDKKKKKEQQKSGEQSGFRRAVRNAVPWMKNSNESSNNAKPAGNGNTDSDENQKKNQQSLQQQQQRPVQPMPFGGPLPANGSPFDPVGPSPPIILTVPSAISPRQRYPQGMPMRPQSQTDATLAGLVTSLLPLLSRLAVAAILSGFSLFGHGDSQIYAPNPSQHFMFERLNDRYERDGLAMKKALIRPPHKMNKSNWSLNLNVRKRVLKKRFENMEKEIDEEKRTVSPSSLSLYSRTVIVLDFQTRKGDMQDIVKELSDAVTFILSQYHNKGTRLDMGVDLEVIICIESPGGVVQDYGLAADQLIRLKEAAKHKDLTLTVCVDKVAASGGYLMACHATPGQLMAAPYAVIGSIGVMREMVNFHDLLEKGFVRPLLLTAGHAKVPVTPTSEITEEKLAIVQEDLEKVHDAFRATVKDARGDAIAGEFDDVTNGSVYLGKDAADKGLVDHLKTSDEYIAERVQAGDRVLRLHKYDRNRMGHLRLSPLDLLLLKTTDGTLGKMFGNMMQRAIRIGPQLMKVGGMMGAIKVIDETYQCSSKRRRLQDDI